MADPLSVTVSVVALVVGTGAFVRDVIQVSGMRNRSETRYPPLISFLGETGAGKSTLVQRVTRLNIL